MKPNKDLCLRMEAALRVNLPSRPRSYNPPGGLCPASNLETELHCLDFPMDKLDQKAQQISFEARGRPQGSACTGLNKGNQRPHFVLEFLLAKYLRQR